MHIKLNFSWFLLLVFIYLPAGAKVTVAYDALVAKDGSGKFTSIQQAINNAPEGRTTPYKIFIKAGIYTEQIIIPATKPFIELIGEDVARTIIAYGDGKGGTSVVVINANDCMLMNITMENTQGRLFDGPQSLAVKTNADRIVFFNCRFISGQDTVLTNRDGNRVYFNNCYIDGNTDFIYGAAVAVFDHCVIFPRDRVDGGKGGYVTAASTPAGQQYGLVFRDCTMPNNHGLTSYTLGRPWQNDSRTETQGRKRAENKVVFLNTAMSASIVPSGWSIWDDGTKTAVITYAEYKTTKFDGTPVDLRHRVPWSQQLTDSAAKTYYDDKLLFGDWDPFTIWKDLPKETTGHSIAIANFMVRSINNMAILQFNSSWPQNGVTYQLLTSPDKRMLFKNTSRLITKTDTIAAYQFNIAMPAENQVTYYLIRASKGNAIEMSDTLSVSISVLNKSHNLREK